MWAGIDYSMTCPAITVGSSKEYSKCKSFFYNSGKSFSQGNIYGTPVMTYEHQMERFYNITGWALAILKQFKISEVCMEGYAMAGKGQVFNIAENTGLLKYHLWKNNIKYHLAAPTSAKKYFSGKGNANKEFMYQSFLEKTNINLENILNKKCKDSPISDIVDSYAMLCYGIDNYF